MLFDECFDLLLTILDDLFRVIVVIYDIVELDLNGFHYGFDFLLHGLHLSPQVKMRLIHYDQDPVGIFEDLRGAQEELGVI